MFAAGEVPTGVAAVLANGTAITDFANPVVVSGLKSATEYSVYVAVEGDGGQVLSDPVVMTTETAIVELTSATIDGYYSPDNYTLIFSNDAYDLTLDFYTGSSTPYLLAGTYNVVGSSAMQIDPSYSSLKDKVASSNITIKSGTVEIQIAEGEGFSENTYTILANLTVGEGETFVASYTGQIANMTRLDFTLAAAKRIILNNTIVPGEYAIRVNDANYNVEARFDFYADASTSELPAGTYTLSSDKTANSLGVASYLSAYSSIRRFDMSSSFGGGSGTVVVTKNGNVYTFDIQMIAPSGLKYVGTYTGEISNMDLSE
ncbi:MAG: hypothetical protein Q4D56_04440 [Bacteroides sp.]|nr:hypothetical protein [Bacteroides sp.]